MRRCFLPRTPRASSTATTSWSTAAWWADGNGRSRSRATRGCARPSASSRGSGPAGAYNRPMRREKTVISPVSEIVAEIRAGNIVVLVDDEDRENEGDLVFAADFVTPEKVN